jgi:hypothetical protein
MTRGKAASPRRSQDPREETEAVHNSVLPFLVALGGLVLTACSGTANSPASSTSQLPRDPAKSLADKLPANSDITGICGESKSTASPISE